MMSPYSHWWRLYSIHEIVYLRGLHCDGVIVYQGKAMNETVRRIHVGWVELVLMFGVLIVPASTTKKPTVLTSE
jgi:hypothetical protein